MLRPFGHQATCHVGCRWGVQDKVGCVALVQHFMPVTASITTQANTQCQPTPASPRSHPCANAYLPTVAAQPAPPASPLPRPPCPFALPPGCHQGPGSGHAGQGAGQAVLKGLVSEHTTRRCGGDGPGAPHLARGPRRTWRGSQTQGLTLLRCSYGVSGAPSYAPRGRGHSTVRARTCT